MDLITCAKGQSRPTTESAKGQRKATTLKVTAGQTAYKRWLRLTLLLSAIYLVGLCAACKSDSPTRTTVVRQFDTNNKEASELLASHAWAKTSRMATQRYQTRPTRQIALSKRVYLKVCLYITQSNQGRYLTKYTKQGKGNRQGHTDGPRQTVCGLGEGLGASSPVCTKQE